MEMASTATGCDSVEMASTATGWDSVEMASTATGCESAELASTGVAIPAGVTSALLEDVASSTSFEASLMSKLDTVEVEALVAV